MAVELKTDEDVSTITDADLMGPVGDKDTTYQVQHITPKKHAEIVRQHTKRAPNKRTHQMDEIIDWEAVGEALLDYVVKGWSGITYKGEPLPCTLEFKLRLDAPRRSRLLDVAGMNEVAAAPERRAESFREGAEVR
jgi:hypothetical protein